MALCLQSPWPCALLDCTARLQCNKRPCRASPHYSPDDFGDTASLLKAPHPKLDQGVELIPHDGSLSCFQGLCMLLVNAGTGRCSTTSPRKGPRRSSSTQQFCSLPLLTALMQRASASCMATPWQWQRRALLCWCWGLALQLCTGGATCCCGCFALPWWGGWCTGSSA